MDFIAAEVWKSAGWITDSGLIFMRVGPCRVCIAGMTHSVHLAWMRQMTRNATMADTGFDGCAGAIVVGTWWTAFGTQAEFGHSASLFLGGSVLVLRMKPA